MHHLEYRKLLQLNGDIVEIKNFLQGLITNDISQIKAYPAEPLYGLMLTPQGKIISDLFIYQMENHVLIDLPIGVYHSLAQKMQMYKIGRKIEIFADVQKYVHIKHSESDDISEPRIQNFERVISDKIQTDSKTYEEYRVNLIRGCIPEFNEEIESEKFYPIDFDMDQIAGAINYEKGCYVGQEVTARTKYRGVKRKFLKIVNVENLEFEEGKVVNQFAQSALLLARKPL